MYSNSVLYPDLVISTVLVLSPESDPTLEDLGVKRVG